MAIRPAVSYTHYDTSSREQTGDIITLSQFEEGNLLSETQNILYETLDNVENSNKSDDDSNMPPLISEEEMDAMDSGDESDDEPMYMKMLENNSEGSQSHPRVNKREECYKICDCIKQSQA